MAKYYLGDDGSISKNKKSKGNQYKLQDDGTIKQINLPTIQTQTQTNNTGGFLKGGSNNFLEGLWNTYWDLSFDVGKGALQTIEGIADFSQYLTADMDRAIADRLENKLSTLTMGNVKSNFASDLLRGYSDWLEGNAKYNSTGSLLGENENAQETLLGNQWRKDIKEQSYIGDMGSSIAQGVGNVAAMAAVGAVTGGVATAAGLSGAGGVGLSTAGKMVSSGLPSFTSAYGNSMSEALNNGASSKDAHVTATINGLAEAISEQFFEGMPGLKSAGWADKLTGTLADKLTGALGTNVGKVFLKLTDGLGEGAEEIISNVLVALGNDFVHLVDKDFNYGMEGQTGNALEDIKSAATSEDSIKSFISAAFTSALLGGGQTILNKQQTNQVISAYAKDNNMSFKEAKQLLTGETLESTKQGMDRADYDTNVEFNEAAEKRILNYMEQHTGENIESRIEDLIKVEEQNKGIEYSEEDRAKLAEKIRKDLIDRTNNPDKYSSFRMDEASEEEKNSQLYKDFNRLANNTKESHKLYNFYKALKGRNENSVFELTNNEELVKEGYLEKKDGKYGRTIDGKFVEEIPNGINLGNKILINADGLNAFEATTWHEIAHSIKDSSPEGYNELKQIVKDYYGENDYQKYEQKYRDLYGDSDLLEDEYVNDKLGEMLNNEDFIERISGNQSLLQTLINKIKRTIKYMTSGKEQKRLMKLQDQLEKKYAELYGEAKFEGDESLPFYDGEDARYSLGKHYGDLGKGNDTYYFQMANSRRGTGHFGTGTYFVNEEYQPGESSSYANRPTQSVEFDDYNLFKPQSANDGFDLHDALKEVNYNNNPISQELYNELTPYYEASFRAYNELLSEEEESNYSKVRGLLEQAGIETEEYDGYNSLEYERDLEDKITDVLNDYDRYQGAKRDLERILGITDEQFDKSMQEVRDAKAKYDNTDEMDLLKADSLSTIFMKSLGYNGIDVRGYDQLDNTTYGSVIYDLDNKKPKYSLSQDSQGRELSKEQQEYFKDSKVRDEEGRLLEVYHGTNADFTIFDKNKIGNNTHNEGWFGKGFYFTNLDTLAEGYSKYNEGNQHVMTGYLNLTNPFIWKSIKTEEQMNQFIEEIGIPEGTIKWNPYQGEIHGIGEVENERAFSKALQDAGYDGVIYEYRQQDENHKPVKEIVAFESNQFKNVDNTNPSSNPDIRYSLSTKDNQGKELTKEQQQFFKNVSPEVKDADGNLMRFYHGSNNEFTIFDLSKGGQSNTNASVGFWFTPIESGAENFREESVYYRNLDNGTRKPKTYEVYLKLENPKVYETYDIDTELRDNLEKQRLDLVDQQREIYRKYEYEPISLSNVRAFITYKGEEGAINSLIEEGYSREQATQYINDINEENRIREEMKNISNQEIDMQYTDAYEQFKTDIYKLAGKSANDANIGGTGMMLQNHNEYIKQYVENLKKEGYDGIVLKNTGYDADTMGGINNQYVVFDSNQIKNIDNINPTENPDIRYSLSAEGLKNLSKELGESYSMLESNLTGRDRQGIKRYLENYTNIVGKYLEDNNIKVEPAYKDIEFTRVRTPELQQFVKDNDLTIEKLANDQELQDKYFDLWFGENNEEKFTKQWRDLLDFVKDNPRETEIPRPLRAIQREMQQIRDGETQEIDESATKSKKLDTAIDNGYDFWIEEQITPLFEKIDYDVDEVMDEAKANHGTTDDYNTGAYMTTDGSLLDFDDGGYRDDHRTISVFNLDMQEFMDYGAIRMKPEANGFEMAVEPTTKQYSKLEDYIDNYLKTNAGVHGDNSTIWVDFDIPGTNNYNSASYNINTPTSKIINDIKEYWRTGELPKQSEYADFYYSLSKTNEAPVRTQGTYTEDIAIPTIDYNLPTQEVAVETQNVPVNERIDTEDRLAEQRRKLADKRIKTMIEKQTYKSVKQATKIAKDYLGFDSKETQQFREGIEDLARKRKDNLIKAENYQEVKDLVGQYANRDMTFINEEMKEAQKDVKKAQIIVSDDLKNQITDWGDFRKYSRLNIKKGQNSNIDSVYQELAESYPGMIDESIINPADQLIALSEFAKRDTKYVEHYQLSDNTINQITNRVWEKLSQNALTKQEINDIQDDINKRLERRTREVVQNDLLEQMGITLDDIQEGNDINSIAIQRTDPKRLNEKVFGYNVGKKINDATVNFVNHQEAERTRFLNKEREEIKDLGIKPRSKESAAVQKYGEKQYVNDKGEVVKYTEQDLMNEFPNRDTQEKIKKAARVLREKYDRYIDQENEVLTEMGYDPIPKRQDYFRHFIELEDKLSQWGIPYSRQNLMAEDLSTDINGLTDQFKPGKNFFASALERKGMKTTYDAITGIDQYLEGASNLIYQTESIQRYRTLSKFIRETFGQKHGLDDVDLMTDEQREQRIQDVYNNKLTRYAAWLDEQANSLAGKKGAIDRAAERFMGRRIYTALNALKSQVGSNMTGFNVRSSMTNFASAIQGAAKTNKIAFLEGTMSTLRNIIHDDGLIDKSDFLTNRFGSDTLSKKAWQKISNAGQIFMTGTDYFTANQIWRGKYYEGLNKGLTEDAAIKQADDFAARIMGDRSKGQTAEIFNSKTLGLLTQFQLEVNNQWSSMIHDNKMEFEKDGGIKTAAKVTFQLGQLYAMSYMFNGLMKALTGSDVMFDPIEILKGIFAPPDDDDDEEVNYEERATEAIGKIIDQLPMASIFTGGRIPLSEAFTGVGTLAKKLTNQKDQWGNEYSWEDVKDDLIASAFYYLLPTGYGQIKKTAQGLGQYGQILPEPIEQALDIYHNENLPLAGNYTKTGRLKYEADTSTQGKVQSALFGRNASANAQEYREKGYQALSEKKVNEALSANLPISEYREIDSDIANAKKLAKEKGESQQEAQYDYIYNLPLSMEQKNSLLNARLGTGDEVTDDNGYVKYTDGSKTYWYDEKNDVVYNSKYRAMSNIDVSDLTKYSNKKDLTNYGDYESLDEFNYATKNPLKYKMLKQISTYSKYNEYKDDIAAIKDNYNDGTTAGKNAAYKSVFNYIEALPLNENQKLMLLKMAGGYSIKSYKKQMRNYIESLSMSADDKQAIYNELF